MKLYNNALFILLQTLVAHIVFFHFSSRFSSFGTDYAKIILTAFGLIFLIASLITIQFKKRENKQSLFKQLILKSFRFLIILFLSISILFQSEMPEKSAGILFVLLYFYFTIPELIAYIFTSFKIR